MSSVDTGHQTNVKIGNIVNQTVHNQLDSIQSYEDKTSDLTNRIKELENLVVNIKKTTKSSEGQLSGDKR